MRRPVLLGLLRTLVRAVLLSLLPAFALPLVTWTSAGVPADAAATELAPSTVLSAPPADGAAGDGDVLAGHPAARPAPTDRLTGAAPPPPDEPPVRRAVTSPPRPTATPPHGFGPDTTPARPPDHEPTLGRGPPSVTRT